MTAMSPEQTFVKQAMENMGWKATRIKGAAHPRWRFARADTGGLWDRVEVQQANMSMIWLVDTALRYGDAGPLDQKLNQEKARWLNERFPGLLRSNFAELIDTPPERGLDTNAFSMETAPKDSTMLRLLVDYRGDGRNPLDDEHIAWTIGFNSYDNTGDDVWSIAGWDWSQDEFTYGKGTPIGWLPFHAMTIEKSPLKGS